MQVEKESKSVGLDNEKGAMNRARWRVEVNQVTPIYRDKPRPQLD